MNAQNAAAPSLKAHSVSSTAVSVASPPAGRQVRPPCCVKQLSFFLSFSSQLGAALGAGEHLTRSSLRHRISLDTTD